ncbi:hypothetical protein C8R43DRAFT_1002221 [Mycena crocata]|nr:hypothetical protein C8R43DRAFT_1002221 [Mycena crocata]
MWKTVFRARGNLASATNGHRTYSSRNSKITAYLRSLSFSTRDPIWRLIVALHYPKLLSLSEALDISRISLDDFSRWRASLYASDIDQAMRAAGSTGYPSWLALYLTAFKVRAPRHASGSMLDLSFAHIESAPPAIQGPLLVMTMIHLTRFDLMWPMPRVIDAFLSVPFTQFQGLHFNHLLAAMTSISQRSQQTGENAVKVLRAMEARQLRLWPRTCSALIEDRYTALQLTGYLRRRMTRLGVVPTASQLESYLRVYSAEGAIHDAKRYAEMIRRFRRPDANEKEAAARPYRLSRASTLLIGNQPDSASAFEFLLKLTAKATRDKPTFNDPSRHALLRPAVHPRLLLGKRGVDVHDWSAALSVAAHDLTVDAKTLTRLFMRTHPKTHDFRPTVASHTVLIRGLLLRHEWEAAYIYWTKLARSGLPIDEMALATGLRATTLSGRPAEAFAVLEMHAALADAALASPYRLHRPLRVTAYTINTFMSSLRRILRPDLVFRLWDSMEELYRVRPSTETLRIMLEAAQLPHTLDDSFSGQLALLALKNPFRNPKPPPATRAALVESLTAQAAAPYRSGVWRERPASTNASRIFVQAALGVPERLHLAGLVPPAHAVRMHPESDSAALTMRLDMPPSRFALPPDILTSEGRPHFPELVVREREFTAYIMLLGMTRRAPEIARALVWMHALRLQPTEQTLGVALAFWGEVSVQPPLIEAMAGLEGNEYLKLVHWLQGWCAKVPDEQVVGRWRARIAKVRVQRREAVGTGRLVDEEKIWTM